MAKRVLVVDDHRLVREGLRRTLEDAGFEVVGEAENGADGLEMAERLRPHVALMDVSMPVVDGITATRRMRSRAPDTRVIVLTMHADTDLVEKARSAGAAGYLLKDASGDEVVQAVRRALPAHDLPLHLVGLRRRGCRAGSLRGRRLAPPHGARGADPADAR